MTVHECSECEAALDSEGHFLTVYVWEAGDGDPISELTFCDWECLAWRCDSHLAPGPVAMKLTDKAEVVLGQAVVDGASGFLEGR